MWFYSNFYNSVPQNASSPYQAKRKMCFVLWQLLYLKIYYHDHVMKSKLIKSVGPLVKGQVQCRYGQTISEHTTSVSVCLFRSNSCCFFIECIRFSEFILSIPFTPHIRNGCKVTNHIFIYLKWIVYNERQSECIERASKRLLSIDWVYVVVISHFGLVSAKTFPKISKIRRIVKICVISRELLLSLP